MKCNPVTRETRAFIRFADGHKRHRQTWLIDHFYEQACYALGFCNRIQLERIDKNDPRWDGLFKDDKLEARK